MLATKRMRLPLDVIFVCIRWHVAYSLSYMVTWRKNDCPERGVFVDHSSINRWAIRVLPLFKDF